MTVLITLEFGHTLQYFFGRGKGIIQAKIVIVIALLALARKAIVTDPFEAAPAAVFALAALTLALGVTYWLMRDRDHRLRAGAPARAPDAPRRTACPPTPSLGRRNVLVRLRSHGLARL